DVPEEKPAEKALAGAAAQAGGAAGAGETDTPQESAPSPEEDDAGGGAPGEAAAPAQPPRMRDFTVLVVDDERDSRDLMAHYLEDFGCNVLQAGSGEDGLKLAVEHQPDLITLDLMMPGMTGWEVLKELKADPVLRRIPVVVVSIVAGEGRGQLLGAVDLVTKPFEREDLLRVLWRNLVRKRGGRVLVVDDDPRTRKLLTEYLGSLGLEVVTAEDGQEGLAAVRSEAPDAVLLDLLMPVMDGMTFLQRLRSDPNYLGLPVLVLTAKELDRKDLKQLSDMASAVVMKDDTMAPTLKEMLSSIFTLTESVSSE
ncbi:MAG: response regulator, partial [Gemmatimonadota bacterium]